MMPALCLLLALWSPLSPVTAQGSGPCFRAFPVETPLQRHLLGVAPDAPAVYVSVWCNAAVSAEGALLLDRPLLFDTLSAALGDNVDPGTASVQYSLVYEGITWRSSEEARGRVQAALSEVAAELRIGTVGFSITNTSQSGGWVKSYGDLEPLTLAGGAEEQLVRGVDARIAPVRTALSRQLLSQADLYLEVLHPIRAKEGYVSAGLADSLGRDLSDLAGEGRSVAVRVPCLVAKDGFLDCMQSFQTWLGQREMTLASFTVSLEEDPRADDLIGKAAPDFTLEDLASKAPRSLAELSRGKVTLLAFWGVG